MKITFTPAIKVRKAPTTVWIAVWTSPLASHPATSKAYPHAPTPEELSRATDPGETLKGVIKVEGL